MNCCSICSDEHKEWELQDGICSDCLASIVQSSDISPNEEDFL